MAKKKKKEIPDTLSMFDFQSVFVFKHTLVHQKPLAELVKWIIEQDTFHAFEFENKFDHYVLTVESGNTFNLTILTEKIQELFPETDYD